MIKSIMHVSKSFLTEEDGFEVVEWALLLAGIILPAAIIIYKIMEAIPRYYSYCSWVISLPFP